MSEEQRDVDESFWAPGTLSLEDIHRAKVILFPTPSADPNDPLNWSRTRKAINYTLVCFFVLWTFVNVDIGFTAWEPMQIELNLSNNDLNVGAAANYAGLAIGCVFFIPLAHKFGRRPIYILSTALQLASCVWSAETHSYGDYVGSNFLAGLGGAISEIIVQITVADIFFVHQHGTMNAWFIFFQSTGACLGPVASGYITIVQNWRWMWWWCAIFLGITFFCVLFFFEESKFVPAIQRQDTAVISQPAAAGSTKDAEKSKEQSTTTGMRTTEDLETRPILDPNIKPKTYLERMAMVTPTDEPIWPHFSQSITILFTMPAASYTAITYGSSLAWFAILASLQATYLIVPPYNFGPVGIGLMNVSPFVGSILGFLVGGYLNDKSIIWLSKRNGGIYEPEMRLWLALPIIILGPGSILMFGLGLAHGVHWSLLAVGYGLFGFTLAVVGSISLSYLMDCYQDIIGNALVGVVFVRNIISVVVLFTLTPWVDGMGVQNLHILCAMLALVIYALPIPLLIWGKSSRIAAASSYRNMAANQISRRMV